jgi:hypothetical protein
MREEPDVKLSCGHYANSLGALRVLGSVMGQLEQWCDCCSSWCFFNPAKVKAKARRKKPDPQKEVLF